MARLTTLFSLLCVAISANAALSPFKGIYLRSEEFIGQNFLQNFNFEAIDDPTHGRVNYVNSTVAIKEKLVVAKGNSFILRADSKEVLDPAGPGRKSVRLISKKLYTNGVMVFDIKHMPQGCGTWPAVWTVGLPWPHLGELDIVEGVNDQGPNSIVVHTSDGCDMPPGRLQSGNEGKLDCGIGTTNEGCPVRVNHPKSYGPAFNANGGGWFATERTDEFIKVWFWARNDKKVPLDVRLGVGVTDTSRWGIPAAVFLTNPGCNMSEKFGPHYLVINLTFCGDWAGNEYVYGQSGCPSTCVDYVNNNPEAFKNAHFEFNSIRIYKPTRLSFAAAEAAVAAGKIDEASD